VRFAAVVPAAPALLPRLTGGPVRELEPVRTAVSATLTRLGEALAAGRGRLVVVAPGTVTRLHDPSSRVTLSGYGAPDPEPNGLSASQERLTGIGAALPPQLALALELLRAAGVVPGADEASSEEPDSAAILVEVAANQDPSKCHRLGARLEAEAGPDGTWLVLGDGSARRSPKAPGALDEDALPFDTAVAKALATVDIAAIRDLHPARAHALMAAGRAPWQVLAGAVDSVPPSVGFEAGNLFHDAPLGVGYFTVAWRRTAPEG
jgi:hypothetical protein